MKGAKVNSYAFMSDMFFSMVGLNCGIVGVILGCIFMGKKKLSNVGFALSLVAGISSILIIFFEVVMVFFDGKL